ncbi:capsular polysaccharide export protein, LipB/KpsS family [Methylorubrum extorquens]|uniref:capsular polysaccharide export protein, LipB/KpsS family n=1 Tax=Methylorubrum extorquens TaxID=408 RepID=UPI0020A18923|nr:capsular biosynthesis protein [Methylorubrum extorquens]MCP1536945.1 capsular polysaccharide export protein [Methylorubrum extorquens]
MTDLRPIEPQGDTGLPRSYLPLGRTVRLLRAQIEAATGASLTFRSPGPPALWSATAADGKAVLRVAPGPLLSPYDSPETGLSSLRLSYAGRPLGGEPPSPDFGDLLRARGLAGFNRFARSLPDRAADLFSGQARPALALIDPQTAASGAALRSFLTRLLAENPGTRFVAAGPDGCPRDGAPTDPRLTVIAGPADPWLLFPLAARIHVARWDAACEAALAGFETHYPDPAAGPRPADAAAFLALRYGIGVHGFDPWTRRPIPLADAVERVAWLRDRFLGNDRRVVLVGVSGWKRAALDVFATGPAGPPLHTMIADEAVALARAQGGRVQAWATRCPEQLPRLCAEAGLPFARIEDGFLRSVGLGASLEPGASIVVDDLGIYYDPRVESRLARTLKEAEFPPGLTARAAALRESIVARRLSKYNVGLEGVGEDWPTDRRIVLVPGQVEDDASVLTGSPQVRGNLALLRAARARNPDAFLLYKPHPDVEAGFRPGAIPEVEVRRLADRVVGGLSIVDLLDRCHHVETMTSLAGFEALIRGLSVAVHGRPFYAGWGLTEDLAPGADRGRTLSLDALVAGALILYPLYLDPVAMKPCTPEQLLDRLSEARAAAPPSRLALGAVRHATMRLRYALINPVIRRLRARRGVRSESGR